MMTQRKSLSKKIRFEVFKRDSFTCQYCGLKAPDAILEVDHLEPVSLGGKNDILNLITSCFNCNRGKSKNRLSDNAVFDKQRKQIEDLNLRRQQLEMMLEWKNELLIFKETELNYLVEYAENLGCVFELNNVGIGFLKKLLNQNGLDKSLKALDISFDTYFVTTSIENFWTSVEKSIGVAKLMDRPDHEKKIGYIIGVLKNRFDNIDIHKVSRLLNNMYSYSIDINDLDDASRYAKKCLKFDHFCNYLSNFNY